MTTPSPAWVAAVSRLIVAALIVTSTGAASMRAPDGQPVQLSNTAQRIPGSRGILQGFVLDARSGRPVTAATVDVIGAEQTTTASTDNEGRYAVDALPSGEYRVQARARGYVPAYYGQRDAGDRAAAVDVRAGRLTRGIDVRLMPAGTVSGRVFDDRGDGLAGVEIELVGERYVPGGTQPTGVAFAQTGALGAFRLDDVLPGSYRVRAYASAGRRPTRADGGDTYGMTYYPGVPSAEHAHTLQIGAGQELFDVDFALAAVRTHRVAGTLIDPTGREVKGTQIRVMPLGPPRATYAVTAGADGQFDIGGIMPGDYRLLVVDAPPISSRWAAAIREITVSEDVIGLELRARSEARIEGRLVRDDAATGEFDPAGATVRFERRRPETGGVHIFAGAAIGADGTFSLESPGGPASIQIADLPKGWTMKIIRLDDTQIGDEAVDFGEGGHRRVEIVVTNRSSELSGTVADRRGKPISNASIVVFPDNPAQWGVPSRQVREERSRTGGAFRIDALPPGNYFAVAVDALPFNAWLDPDVLARLQPAAVRVRITEGEHHVVTLRLSPRPEGLLLTP